MSEGHVAVVLVVSVFSLALGGWLWRCPSRAIEIQRRFYLRINWRMDPVSMDKEIRNTRWMGLFLIGFVPVAWFTLFQK